MADDLAGWFEAAIGRAKQEGSWKGMTALARRADLDRQVLYDILKGRQAGQEKVRAIAKALGVPTPRVGAVVAPTGASAAVLASLEAARSDLRSALARLEAAERGLLGATESPRDRATAEDAGQVAEAGHPSRPPRARRQGKPG